MRYSCKHVAIYNYDYDIDSIYGTVPVRYSASQNCCKVVAVEAYKSGDNKIQLEIFGKKEIDDDTAEKME